MLSPYFGAAFAAVAVETVEEDRFVQSLLREFPAKSVLSISATGGLQDLRTRTTVDAEASFAKAFEIVAGHPDTLLVVLDWQHLARNAGAYRALKNHFGDLKANGCCAVLVAPTWSLPQELEHDVPILQWHLPDRQQLLEALMVVADSVGETVTPENQSACLDAAAGLTLQEAENSFALALVECGSLDPRRVEQEKMRLVKNSGFLEFWPAVSPDAVGGLDNLKDYFREEVLPCLHDEDLRVRGALLVGIPGTGKSLASKTAGALLGWPVLRLDISALKGSLVGQSESNMRAALKLAEAVSPCVLWLDEIEKGVGGYQSSASSDSGVTLGMVGALLTWLQEHKKPIFTIGTCNDYSKLPVELTRAGRFDERFFLDMPSQSERVQIAEIHLNRFNCEVETGLSQHIADQTQGWTGAEIEQIVKSAARRSARKPTMEDVALAASNIKPLSQVRGAEIEKLRSWAQQSLRFANTPDETPARTPMASSPVSTRRRDQSEQSANFGISLN